MNTTEVSNNQIYDLILKQSGDFQVLKEKLECLEQKLDTRLNEADSKIDQLLSENKILKSEIERLDHKIRKNNLVIFGIDKIGYRGKNLREFVIDKLDDLLQLQVDRMLVSDVYAVGGIERAKRPIIVEFSSYQEKLKVLKKVGNLKGTKLFISEDLSKKDRADFAVLRENLNLAKSKGYNARIQGRKLIINGEIYTADTLNPACVTELVKDPQIVEVKSNSAPPTPEIRQTPLASGVVPDPILNKCPDLLSQEIDKVDTPKKAPTKRSGEVLSGARKKQVQHLSTRTRSHSDSKKGG